MDGTLGERLFRAQLQVQSEETRTSRAVFLWCIALLWGVVVLAAPVLIFSGDPQLSLPAYAALLAALPPSFLLGRRHARKMCQHLWR